MDLQEFFTQFVPQIEAEMRACLSSSDPALNPYYGMLDYHLGWVDERFAPAPTSQRSGKRIRPMLCVLVCRAAQGDPGHALPPPPASSCCTTSRSSTTTLKTTAQRGEANLRCGSCGACRKRSIAAMECLPWHTWRWIACANAASRVTASWTCERRLTTRASR
jgi:geranylgeranyl pyrophosphate synthase